MRVHPFPSFPLFSIAATLAVSSTLSAQQLLFQYSDPIPYRFPHSVAVLGDLDGDGTPEIGLGSWGDGPFIISGATGTVLHHSTGNVEAYGISVDGLPDITGDGIPDYIVGSRHLLSGGTPLHEVRSGADGSLVYSGAFGGFEVTGLDDLDGDSWPDYALVDERALQIRSGINGAVLGAWSVPPGEGDRLNRVARTGDVNGDGIPDVVGGQWDWPTGGGTGPGRVRMISGADGSLLWTNVGSTNADFFGMDVTGDIDVNFDGIPDVVAITGPWGHPVDYVRVLSGLDGSLLRAELMPKLLRTTLGVRYSVVTLPDLDGDGVADYAIGGADGSCVGIVELRSGASGTPLLQITNAASGFGTHLDGSSDWDGDGFADLAVAARNCSGNGGAVFVYSLASVFDCNGNGVLDGLDIAGGFSQDCNTNGVPDECDLATGTSQDCNLNTIPDECDLVTGVLTDCDDNGTPDQCEFYLDCNLNGLPDACDLLDGTSLDCNANDIPDECDIDSGWSQDCNSNGVPDECDLAAGTSLDCNDNQIPDECDLASGSSSDCNGNGVLDECDLADGTSQDCNTNQVPDECDIASGSSGDLNGNGIPDECECSDPVSYCTTSPNSVGTGSAMGSVGLPSVSLNDFTIAAAHAPPGQFGLLFYGANQANQPFGEGIRCVGGLIFRLNPPALVDANGRAAKQVDFTQPPAGGGMGQITSGSTWNFQFWYRDAAGGPTGFNLSDGLAVTFCP